MTRQPPRRRLRPSRAWVGCVAAVMSAQALAASPAPATEAPPASSPRRVLLVIDQPDDPFSNRVHAELTALGLVVLAVEPWRTGEPIDTLESAARAAGAIAAVRTIRSGKGVEIWMADQVTGRPLLRQLVVDESPGGPNQSLIALQTAELMRTSLLSRPAPAPAPPAPAVVSAPPPPPPPPAEVGVAAGLGGLWSPGGDGAALQVWLSTHVTLTRRAPRLALALDLSAPARAARLSGPEGSSTVQTTLAAAALLARAELPLPGLMLEAGLGAGVVRIAVDGQARPPLAGTSDATLTAAGYLRAELAFQVARRLRLGVRGVAGAAARRVTVRFAGNDAGSWGPAFAVALGMIEIAWP